MNKTTRTIFSICGGLILLGGALVGVSCALGAGGTESHEVTYTVDESFTNILVNVTDAEVVVRPSNDGTCYAVCDETDKITYSVQAANGALHVRVQDERSWLDYIGIHFDVRTVALYLPESAYELLDVTSMSGSIVCESSFTFDRVKLESKSGLIRFGAVATDNLTAKSASGSITLENFGTAAVTAESASGRILCKNAQPATLSATSGSGSVTLENVVVDSAVKAETTSGAILFQDGRAESLSFSSGSGSVTLENVVTSGDVKGATTSGSIRLDACDGANLTLKSKSGSVRGTLLSGKIFQATSSSGSIHVPDPEPSAGICKITTVSGSIDIKIEG